MTVQVRSFAKINLGLRIGPRREDGFHELLTVYQTLALYDVIRVTILRGRGIEIRCEDPRVPCDESNTCYRTIEKAIQALNAKGRVVIEIDKRLPVQGGMGGASSNAVAAMLGMERALQKSLNAEERLRIAAEVGSDLPFFLIGGTVLGVGRGEQVYPLEDLPAMACGVVTPEVGVSTPKAFAEWDRLYEQYLSVFPGMRKSVRRARTWLESHSPSSAVSIRGLRDLESKLTPQKPSDTMNQLGRKLTAWLSESYSGAPLRLRSGRGRAENPLLGLVRTGIRNDFEQVVFPEYPELSEIKKALLRAGAKYASLSGSGSTLYGLFASKEAAGVAARKLQTQGWATQVTATLVRRAYWSRIFD
jgi:4-diphosphocytidyl-2-C-methyl-D-erythritol kinase